MGREKSLGHEMGRDSEKGGREVDCQWWWFCGGRCVGVLGLGREKCWGERWTVAGDGVGR